MNCLHFKKYLWGAKTQKKFFLPPATAENDFGKLISVYDNLIRAISGVPVKLNGFQELNQ
jgi:hypothetical protein